MSCVKALLAASPWTHALSPEQLRRVEADSYTRNVPKGCFVCRKGGAPTHWMGIADGLVKMTCTSLSGNVTTLSAATTGAWFGEGTLMKAEAFRYEVTALRDSEVVCLPKTTFFWLLDNNIGFARFLLEQMNARVSHFIGMLEYDRLLSPDARVAHCLAACHNPLLSPGFDAVIEVTQGEIAHLAGLSRQRLSRALTRLETDGLVQVEYGKVAIRDLDGLRSYE